MAMVADNDRSSMTASDREGPRTAEPSQSSPSANEPPMHTAAADSPRPKATGSSPPPIARGSSTTIAAAEPAAPAKVEAPKVPIDPELVTRATTIGEIWATECVRDLRAQHRDIVGGWPGTLREARRRVLAAMPRNTDPLLLDDLAKLTNLAARRGWESVSEPDLEP